MSVFIPPPSFPLQKGIDLAKSFVYAIADLASAAVGYAMAWADTFKDATGINAGASSGYTRRGTPNFDVIRNTLSPVSLLLHMNDDGKIDSSTTPGTGTLNGGALFSSTQKKFGNTSLYCDGTGDYLRYADAAKFDIGTSDFCFEGFFRADSLADAGFWDIGVYSNAGGIGVRTNGTDIYLMNNNATVCTGAHGMSTGTWHHLAVVRNSGIAKIYVDGVEKASASFSTSLSTTYGLDIGGTVGVRYFTGYIDEVRLSNVARYTAAFTPPSAVFVSDANTLLLCHFENMVTDSSDYAHVVTHSGAGAAISTAQKKFGVASCLFDGSTGYLEIPDHDVWDSIASSGQFCMDFQLRFVSTAGNQVIWSHQNSGNPDNHNVLRFRWDGMSLIFDNNVEYAGYSFITAAWSPSVNTWYHVALEKNGDVYSIYIDGVLLGSNTQASVSPTYTGACRIGCQWDSAAQSLFNGYLDEFRITVGSVRYGAAFTPPSGEGTAETAGDAELISVTNTIDEAVTSAIVFADYVLNSGTITFYISTDGGAVWTAVTLDEIVSVPSGDDICLKAAITGDAELEFWGYAV